MKVSLRSWNKNTGWPLMPPSERIHPVRHSIKAESYSSRSNETLGLMYPESPGTLLSALELSGSRALRLAQKYIVRAEADCPRFDRGGATVVGTVGGLNRSASPCPRATVPPLIKVATSETGRSKQKVGDHCSTLTTSSFV